MKEYLKFVLRRLSHLNIWNIYSWLLVFWFVVAIVLCVVYSTFIFIGLFIVCSIFIALALQALDYVFIPAYDALQREKRRQQQ